MRQGPLGPVRYTLRQSLGAGTRQIRQFGVAGQRAVRLQNAAQQFSSMLTTIAS